MVRVRAPWGVAYEVRTKNLVFKESDSSHFKVRNLADNAYTGIDLYDLRPQGNIVFQSDRTIDTRNNAAGYVGLRSYDGSNYQTILNLKGGIGELSRIKMLGLNPDLWQNMGPLCHWNHWRPIGILEYAYAGSATIDWTSGSLGVKFGGGSSGNAQFGKFFDNLSGGPSWDKDRYFGARVWVNPHTDLGMWVVTGNVTATSGTSETARHFGFVLNGSNLYPTCANGTSQTLGTAVTVPASYLRLEAILHAANDTIDYYKDGSFLQTLSTNVPNGTTDAGRAFRWHPWDLAGQSVYQYIYIVIVYQEP